MKKLIFLLMILIAVPAFSNPKKRAVNKKHGNTLYLPFAKKGKYGKLPTKKARQKALFRSQCWAYRQWGR